MVSTIINTVLTLNKKRKIDLQKKLGLSFLTGVTNKFARGSWSARDLIKVAELCDMDLMFVSKDRQIMLPITDEPKEKVGDEV